MGSAGRPARCSLDGGLSVPAPTLKFLGIIVQRYRLRSGAPTQGFERYFDRLSEAFDQQLRPALERAGALLPNELYAAAGLSDERWLAAIPDFNTLIANSQNARKPVFALAQEDTRQVGVVWEKTYENIEKFRQTFDQLARRIEILTGETNEDADATAG